MRGRLTLGVGQISEQCVGVSGGRQESILRLGG
jgi:hypothetical protein